MTEQPHFAAARQRTPEEEAYLFEHGSRFFGSTDDFLASLEEEPEVIDFVYPDRARILDEAKGLIVRDRNNQYGEPTQDFSRTAELWTAAFADLLQPGVALMPHHVAVAQILLKVSRLSWSPKKRDNWVDIAGYAGCGYECVEKGL